MIADRRGIIGLPVKLAVCFLILGLMVPLVTDAVRDADDEISVYGLRTQAASLEDAIQRAYATGGTVSVELDIPYGQVLEVGGSDGDEYVIRLVSGGEVVERMFITNPTVPVVNGETCLSGRVTVTVDGSSAHGSSPDGVTGGVEVMAS